MATAQPSLELAARALLNHYVQLVNSGDAGNWDPEAEPEVQNLRQSLDTPSAPAPLLPPGGTIELAICEEIAARREKGLQHYGDGVERTDISLPGWLQHAKEEGMDFIIYLERAKRDVHALEAQLSTLRSANAEMEGQLKLMTEIRDSYISLNDDKATRLSDTQAKLEEAEQFIESAKRDATEWFGKWEANQTEKINLRSDNLALSAALKHAREALDSIDPSDVLHSISYEAIQAALAAPADMGIVERIAETAERAMTAMREGNRALVIEELARILTDLGGQPNP